MDIVNMASFGWQVVTDNKPQSSVAGSHAHAMPGGVNWQELSAPAGENVFRWTFENGLVLPDFSYDLSLHWTYGARWRKGGAFITNCWMEVDDHDIGMGGISVNISCSIGHPQNVGLDDKRPVAELPVTVQMAYTTWLWGGGGKVTFAVRGDGFGWMQDHYEDESSYKLPTETTPPMEPAPVQPASK